MTTERDREYGLAMVAVAILNGWIEPPANVQWVKVTPGTTALNVPLLRKEEDVGRLPDYDHVLVDWVHVERTVYAVFVSTKGERLVLGAYRRR